MMDILGVVLISMMVFLTLIGLVMMVVEIVMVVKR